jgi:formate hydrogenlyase subunit 3/multisubunit Na+/H+ antiporter MnhD subunit
MEDLFKVGGFALNFGFAGLFLMIVAIFKDGQLQLPVFIIGSSLTFICLAFFLYTNLRTRSTARSVAEDLPLLDALQRTAYQAVELASVTQSYAFRHFERIEKAVSLVAPMLESLPVLGPAAKRAGLIDATKLSKARSA